MDAQDSNGQSFGLDWKAYLEIGGTKFELNVLTKKETIEAFNTMCIFLMDRQITYTIWCHRFVTRPLVIDSSLQED